MIGTASALGVVLAGDDTVFNIVVTVLVYVAYLVFEASKRKREAGPSIDDELVQVQVLEQLIDVRAGQLAQYPVWQGVVAPIWHHVLAPKVSGLLGPSFDATSSLRSATSSPTPFKSDVAVLPPSETVRFSCCSETRTVSSTRFPSQAHS